MSVQRCTIDQLADIYSKCIPCPNEAQTRPGLETQTRATGRMTGRAMPMLKVKEKTLDPKLSKTSDSLDSG